MICGCDVPSRSAAYVTVVATRAVPGGTTTTEIDRYVCKEHIPNEATDIIPPEDRANYVTLEGQILPTGRK